MTSKKKRLAAWARELARDFHENHFPSRRGIGATDDGLYIYNNNPYSDPRWRHLEHVRFGEWCERAGIKILADETWGEYIGDEGYTRVVILDASPSRMDEVKAAYEDALEMTFAKGMES